MSRWQDLFQTAPVRKLPAGSVVFRREDRVQSVFLVAQGQIALERPMQDGHPLTLHVASMGMLLADASVFAQRYHCDAVAREETQVSFLARPAFLEALHANPQLALDLFASAAQEQQLLRTRVEILRMRRVSDRLDAWLQIKGTPPKGEWIRVADAIGVSPAALYRELARRRRTLRPG